MRRTIKSSKVIGIILTYKHASFLEALYRSLPEGIFDSVIISDDDSGDNIGVIADKLGIPCFSHSRLGYGGNIKYGLQKAMEMGAEYMVEIHGDGQYNIAASEAGVEKAKQGYSLVMGSRFMDWRQPLRDKMPISRYLANVGLSFLARLVLRLPLTEFHNGFRIYSRRLLTTVNLKSTSNDFLFGFEIIAQARYWNMTIGEIPNRCFYANKHTSISIPKSIQYSFQMLGVLFKYIVTRLGFETKLFTKNASDDIF